MLARPRGRRGELRAERDAEDALDGVGALLDGLVGEPLIAHFGHGIGVCVGPRHEHAAVDLCELLQPCSGVPGTRAGRAAIGIGAVKPGITQASGVFGGRGARLVDGVAGGHAVGGVDKRGVQGHTAGTVQIMLQVGVEQLIEPPARGELFSQLLAF